MQELEEDPELRQQVALYKNPEAIVHPVTNVAMDGASDEGDIDESALDIPLDELLDDLDALHIDEEAE
jgi:hypothetical protein